jgi:hypothetical protein
LWLFLKCQNALWSFFLPIERFRSLSLTYASQQTAIDVHNRDGECLLRGTNWV